MKYLWFVGTMILMAWFVFRFVFDSTALFVGGAWLLCLWQSGRFA
jgi:hypothetical protein